MRHSGIGSKSREWAVSPVELLGTVHQGRLLSVSATGD